MQRIHFVACVPVLDWIQYIVISQVHRQRYSLHLTLGLQDDPPTPLSYSRPHSKSPFAKSLGPGAVCALPSDSCPAASRCSVGWRVPT